MSLLNLLRRDAATPPVPMTPQGPLSTARLTWISERLTLVVAMLRELTRTRQLFGAHPMQINGAIERLTEEKLLLMLEQELLQKHLEADGLK